MVKSSTPAEPPAARSLKLGDNDPVRDRLRQLGALQCGLDEVAQSFGVSRSRLAGFFSRHPRARAAFDEGLAKGLEDLRVAQFKLAQTSSTMAIFLGKHYLGQADRRELDLSAPASQAAYAAAAAEAAERVRDKLAGLAEETDLSDFGPGGEGAG